MVQQALPNPHRYGYAAPGASPRCKFRTTLGAAIAPCTQCTSLSYQDLGNTNLLNSADPRPICLQAVANCILIYQRKQKDFQAQAAITRALVVLLLKKIKKVLLSYLGDK